MAGFSERSAFLALCVFLLFSLCSATFVSADNDSWSCGHYNDPNIACTVNGPVQGFTQIVGGYPIRIFFAIPYAQPPIGNLRWKAPVPLVGQQWSTPLNATQRGNVCPPGLFYPDPYNRTVSEDCLTINVWAPVPLYPGEKMPVLQWIHGGAGVEGAPEAFGVGNFSLYAVTHRTIIVAGAYRFNALGWFSSFILNGYTEPEAIGVFGLLDQRLGLKWTKENIAFFNGRPDQVTVYGQSFGAISVCLQTVTPLNDKEPEPLFQGVFSSSGYCDRLPPTNNSEDVFLINGLGCTTLACLLNATWQEIQAVVGDQLLAFQPTVGVNSFLPDQPISMLADRAIARYYGNRRVWFPKIYSRGSVTDEGTFLADDLFGSFIQNPYTGPQPPQIEVDFILIGLGNYTEQFYYSQLAPLYSSTLNPAVATSTLGLIYATNDQEWCTMRRENMYYSLATDTHGWWFDSAPASEEYPPWVDVFHESDVFYVARHADGIWVTYLTPAQYRLGSIMDVYWNSTVYTYTMAPQYTQGVPFWKSLNIWQQNMIHFTAEGEGKGPIQIVPYESIISEGGYAYTPRCNQLDIIYSTEYNLPSINVYQYLRDHGI